MFVFSGSGVSSLLIPKSMRDQQQQSSDSSVFKRPLGRVVVLDNKSEVFRSVPRVEIPASALLDNKSEVFRNIPRIEIPESTLEIASTSSSSQNITNEDKNASPPDTTSNSSPCLLPSSSFSGSYNFDIYFETPKIETNKGGWTYSKCRDKLYVAKDVACPMNFTTESPPPSGTKIRVTAVFAQPEHASEVVRRCINHSFIDLNNGVFNPDHLIRCECDQAVYEIDGLTDRRSVVLPYEHPVGGNQFSTYLFKFACFGSCAGGLNRRPIRVIFTLEVKNKIIARRALDVKICACPWRDSKNEDKQTNGIEKSSGSALADFMPKKRKKEATETSHYMDIVQFVNKLTGSSSSGKKTHSDNSREGTYILTTTDPEEYEFLRQAKKLYELQKTMQSLSPEIIHYLKSIHRKEKE